MSAGAASSESFALTLTVLHISIPARISGAKCNDRETIISR